MASRGLHEFTVQEADNYEAFGDWNYEQLDGAGTSGDLGTALGNWVVAQYITTADPAKQVIIYPKPGITMDADEGLSFYINDTLTQYFQADGSTPNLVNDADFNSSEVTFVVDYGTAFSEGDVILADAELMYVSGISTHTITVTRGYGTSVGAAHANDTILWKVGTPGNHTVDRSVNPIMKLGVDQLPFTMSGIAITYLNMWNDGADGGADNDISILSFH